MLKSLFSAAAIFVLFFATLLSPVVTYARRCPVEPPSTLLSLYRRSDAIYVARFEKSVEGDVIRTDEDSRTVAISDHFTITTTVKGDTKKFFVRNYEEYRYTGSIDTTDESVEESEDQDSGDAKPGDTVLLFLKKGDDGKSLEITHYRDSVKKLSEKQQSPYEARLRELNGIYGVKKVNDAEIVKWLIRCAEDPVTRWEGAFELLQSFEALDWKEEQAKHLKEKIANGEGVNEDNTDIAEGEDADLFDTSEYARLLGDDQKHALANILLNREPETGDNGEAKTPELSDGDRVLIELVKRWGDSRLAAFMLEQLRNAPDDNYAKRQMMNVVAEVLKDKELSSLAEKFGEIAYEKDDGIVGASEKTEGTEVQIADEADPIVAEPAEAEPAADVESSDPESADELEKPVLNEDEPKKPTYRDLRAELLAKFIGRAHAVLAAEEAKKSEK